MTMYKQLVIFTFTIFLLLFTGVWIEKLQSTRSFLINQMESHSQDTATSLGLSLSSAMITNDLATAETMINAVFDRGYYKKITFNDTKGEALIHRVLDVTLTGVPSWFVQLIPISIPQAETLIMSGWTQAGTLTVQSHPGFAYRALWETTQRMIVFFLAAGIIVVVFSSWILKMILKPLQQVEQQAEAICRKEYRINNDVPKTRELQQVVTSMNKMTNQVRDMFATQAKTAEKLRQNSYNDQLTGLGNRRYMTGQVEAQSGTAQGAFLMLQVDDLQKINEEQGFHEADKLLKKVAEIIKEETKVLKNVALARLTGGDFALFITEISGADVDAVAERLSFKIATLATEISTTKKALASIGGISFKQTPSLSILLAEADNALQSARQKGSNKWIVHTLSDESDSTSRGKKWWKDTLENVLTSGDIILFSQPVTSSSGAGAILHQELLARITLDSGEIVSAGMFIPLAEQLHLISNLDKIVLQKAFTHLRNDDSIQSIAINLSPVSISDGNFVQWLLKELQGLGKNAPHFIFEFPEYGAVQCLNTIKHFARGVQNLGHSIALDHFGQSFANFGYLQSLRPEYVKIDRAFTQELMKKQGDSEFFIDALCGVAHSLGIKVIAESVETEEQRAQLLELDIDALQGYLFGKPTQI